MPKLGPVEEEGRLQHRLDDQARARLESIHAGVERRPLIEEPDVRGHLRVRERPPEGALSKRRDEGLGFAGRVRGRVRGDEPPERRRVAGHLVGQLLRSVEELRAQLLGDEQGVRFVVEIVERVPGHAAVDLRDVRQLEQISDGVRPLRPAEPRHPGRRHQHWQRRRRRNRVGIPAETGAALPGRTRTHATCRLTTPQARAGGTARIRSARRAGRKPADVAGAAHDEGEQPTEQCRREPRGARVGRRRQSVTFQRPLHGFLLGSFRSYQSLIGCATVDL